MPSRDKSHLKINHRKKIVSQIAQKTQKLKPGRSTGLDGQGADNGGDDGADYLQHLEYFLPIDFHFTQNNIERNTFN